jgi:outer membrane lipoprotein carrier protein
MSLNAEIELPNNFRADFNQTITNDKGKVIEYQGDVNFKLERQTLTDGTGYEQNISTKLFKWNYSHPTQKEVCTDGVELTVIDHDLEQVSKYLIDDGIDLEQILKVAIKLSNKDYKATYKEIEYIITLDNAGKLERIVYVDNLDNGVKIIFSNMRYNSNTFNDTSLECKEPTDYDVIEG